jgi:hypothetical protein
MKKMIRNSLLLAIAIFCFSQAAVADISAEYVSSVLMSGMQDVALNGNYAYCSMSKGLAVIDIGNLANPNLIREILVDSGMALGSMIAGDYLYVALWSGGLGIYDISEPSNPILVGGINPGGYITDVFILGNYAYLSARYGNIYIVDISTPASPNLEGSLNHSNLNAFCIYAKDTVAYVGGTFGLATVNVANPQAPSFIALCSVPGRIYDISCIGGLFYAACDENGLQVIAAPHPNDMYILGGYQTSGYSYGVFAKDTLAFLTGQTLAGNSGLTVLNVANPEVPVFAGFYAEPNGKKLYAENNMVFVADYSEGLIIIDFSSPPSPSLIGDYRTYNSQCVEIVGDRAYVAGTGFSIVDASDNSNPLTLGQLPLTYNGLEIVVRDTFAYITGYSWNPYTNTGLFEIFSVADDNNPYLISGTPLSRASYSIAIQDDFAYIGGYDSLWIYDISNPQSPARVSSIPGRCDYVAVRGNYAYIPHLRIINVSDPYSPFPEGAAWVGETPSDIVLSGDNAYLATWTGELMVGSIFSFDIANPSSPIFLNNDMYDDDGFCIDLWNNYAIVGSAGGLYFYDITIPALMLPAGEASEYGWVSEIAVSGDYAYMASGEELQIARLSESCCDLAGDFTNNGVVNILDVTAMISNLYKGGPPPTCAGESDANGDGNFNIQDVTYLINYLYMGGPAPICL